MLLNTIVGFIIPWILAGFFYKYKKIFIVICPIASTLAYAINSFGFHFHFWEIFPTKYDYFSTLPFDLGIYPVYASIMIIFIDKQYRGPYRRIFIATLILTLLEYAAVLLNKVHYHNGWNIIFTYFSYLVPLLLVYWYFLLLKRYRLVT